MATLKKDRRQGQLFSPALPGSTLAARHRRVLFLPRFLREEARKLAASHSSAIENAHRIILRWANLEKSGHLVGKETSLDAEFLTEVFCKGLGYRAVTEGEPTHQLTRQFHVAGVGSADAAIGDFTPGRKSQPAAIIELKSADVNVDLDRFNGRTPVQQCWDYLNGLPECPWGIVSNFVSFRLYHRNSGSRAFEHFKLEDLVKREVFEQFFCIFGPGGLLPTKLQPKPRTLVLLELTGQRQREVGDELYASYSHNRETLIHHLHKKREKPLEKAITIAQKLMDRIIFIAFCEDRGLLPGKTLSKTYTEIPPLSRVTNPRWRNFLNLFHAIDKGHDDIGLSHGYNGGLFEHDPEVDDLDLSDDWTGFFKSVGDYDFRDEINVDVLGHLFEKSITELEKLRTGGLFATESGDDAASSRMPQSAKRKRFGIYYTPPEFTAFIVEQTVGAIIKDRFKEIGDRYSIDPFNGNGEIEEATLRTFWNECFEALRSLRVCDPACGSGAFLIEAYEYLEESYTLVIDNLLLAGDQNAADRADQIPDTILAHNLFGVDVSPEAVEISQLALWLRSARRGRTLADLSHNIICGNTLVDDPEVQPQALVWNEAFPEVFAKEREQPGFDCVIGNPPWERVKLQEREHFALSAPKIAGAVSAATRRELIVELKDRDPEMFERYRAAQERAERMLTYARQSGRYPLTGKGDINTYALFAELARTLVAPKGRVGLLVPSGIASDKTTKDFFSALVGEQSLVLLHDFENRRGFFPDVHRSFKFCTLVFGGAENRTTAADFVFYVHTMEELRSRKRHIALSAKDMALVNPNTRTCPIFRTRQDAVLTKRIYRRVPVLVDRTRKSGGNPWGIRFVRMFDQTNDAELFHTAEQLTELGFKQNGNQWHHRKSIFLPLYEAKMIQAYDHRAASVVIEETNWVRQGQTERTSLVAHQNPEFVVQPRWWVAEEAVRSKIGKKTLPAFLCYKDVTSPTNERTMIASFMPFCGVVNSAPLILCDESIALRKETCLLANLNSFALDFVARQKVGNVHLNFFIVEQLPVLAPDAYDDPCPWNKRQKLEKWISDRVLKLTCTAEDMQPLAAASGLGKGIHKWRNSDRAKLKAELDAAYFLLYGLARKDVEYVLSTFTGTQRRDAADVGAFRTEELILDAYDRMSS